MAPAAVAGGSAQLGTQCRVILSLLSTRPDVSATVFGLVVELLWATTDDPSLAQRQVLGRVRLEKAIGRDRLGPADAAAWGAASAQRIAALPIAAGLIADAEQLLDEIDGVELSVLSDLLPVASTLGWPRLATPWPPRTCPAPPTSLPS